MKTCRTFGVEIEMNGMLVSHQSKPDVVATHYSQNAYRPDYREVKLQPGWKVHEDGSCGMEFVSPPLCDTLPILRQIMAIRGSGFKARFRDSGLHVHVGAHDLDRHNLLDLAKFCRHFERAIYSFVHPRRLKGEYCRPLQLSNSALSLRYSPLHRFDRGHRYVGCNVTSYDRHGTVEYRYSESTIDYEKICALVDLFVKITEWVATNKGKTKVKSPRKTKDKRRFLLRLVGVEQETFVKLINTRY